MATGMVTVSGRAMKSVAPNSPSDTAKAKPAPTSAPRARMGASTSRQARRGEAPSTAAASRKRSSMERMTGTTERITKGSAMSE